MKNLLTLIAILISVSGSAQFYQPYYNSVDWSTDMYVNNSGKPAINAPKVSRAFDSSMRFHWYVKSMYFDTLRSNTPADPTGVDRIMWHRMSDGKLMFSLASGWYNKNQVDSGMLLRQTFADTSWDATKSWVNSRGFLTSFTEVDPTVPANVKAITAGNITSWNNKFDVPTGTISQVVLGNGTLGALPPNIDTSSLSNRIDTKLNKTDTASLSGRINTKMGYADTVSLSNRINGKLTAPTITNSVSRTLNTNFTVSSTKMAFVTYSVTCSATNPLLAGSSTANAFLEYSINSGANWVTVSQQSATSSVALAVAVAITQAQTAPISGWVPANALVRLRTTTTGTATVTYISGQETTF